MSLSGWILPWKRDIIRLWFYGSSNLTQSTLQLEVSIFNQSSPEKPKRWTSNQVISLTQLMMQLHQRYWWHKGEGSCITDLWHIKATMKPEVSMYWLKIIGMSKKGLTGRRCFLKALRKTLLKFAMFKKIHKKNESKKCLAKQLVNNLLCDFGAQRTQFLSPSPVLFTELLILRNFPSLLPVCSLQQFKLRNTTQEAFNTFKAFFYTVVGTVFKMFLQISIKFIS